MDPRQSVTTTLLSISSPDQGRREPELFLPVVYPELRRRQGHTHAANGV